MTQTRKQIPMVMTTVTEVKIQTLPDQTLAQIIVIMINLTARLPLPVKLKLQM